MQARDKSSEESKNDAQKYTYSGYTFAVPTVSKTGISLTPKPYSLTKCTYNSKIFEDLHSVWDLNKFRVARTPVEIGKIPEPHTFHNPTIRILDMPIKLAGSNEYKIPDEITPFRSTIQKIIDHEHAILSEEQLLSYHAYLTIDQSYVQAGAMQRKPGAHVDGFQGARICPKTIINHSYVVSNVTPTVFYPQAFNFSHLDERFHDFFVEMDAQAHEEKSIQTNPYTIYLMDAYTVHRASIATESGFRTFLRVSYDVKEFDRLGNTINPLLPYNWEMAPREVQSTLVTHAFLTDHEINLLNSSNILFIGSHLNELKKSNLAHYYNFSYRGIQSKNIDVVKLVLNNLSTTEQPKIQELRLMFVAATLHSAVSAIGKIALINHLKLAKDHIKSNLLLDFVLEMITQKPYFLPTKLLAELVKGQEHTSQGKDIIKLMKKFPDSSDHTRYSCSFWEAAFKHNKPNDNSIPLRAKL